MKLITVLLLLTYLCQAKNSRLNTAFPETKGIASFYGLREQGKRTASGEPFDRMRYTAASRFYRLGTLLMVQYPRTGRFVIVRVNDHGPFKGARILDLSERAATALGLKAHGVGYVIITPVRFKLVNPR